MSNTTQLTAEHLEYISSKIIRGRIINIRAPTGSGKTQKIPPYLSEKLNKKVFISVPTREAARSNAERVKTLTKKSVGYAAGGKILYDENTDIVYATSGHLKRRILGYFSGGIETDWGDYILIIDEVHLQSIENTMIMNLWGKAFRDRKIVPTLILMTATSVKIPGFTDSSSIKIDITVDSYPVKIDSRKGPRLRNRALFNEMANIAINDPGTTGHVLLFVPSIPDSVYIAQMLKSNGKDAIALHSKTSDEDSRRALNPINPREFIVATNIAETSITIPGVVLVIDSMLEMVSVTSSHGGRSLQEQTITQTSSIQRKGRTGRTGPGVYYKMFGGELKPERKPEYKRITVYNEILELLVNRVDPAEIFPGIDIDKAYQFMIKYGAVSIVGNTPTVPLFGSIVTLINASIPSSSFVWKWLQKGYDAYWGAVIGAIIDTDMSKLFIVPAEIRKNRQSVEHADYMKRFSKFYSSDHISTLVNVWLQMEVETSGSLKKKTEGSNRLIYRWCSKNSLDGSSMVELVDTFIRILYGINRISQITHIPQILELGIDINRRGSTSTVSLLEKAIPIIREIFHDRVSTKEGNFYQIDKINYRISTNIPVEIDHLAPIIAINDFQLSTPRGQESFITLFTYESFDVNKYTNTRFMSEIQLKPFVPTSEYKSLISNDTIDDSLDVTIGQTLPEDYGYINTSIPPPLIPISLIGRTVYQSLKNRPKPSDSILTSPPCLMYECTTVDKKPQWLLDLVKSTVAPQLLSEQPATVHNVKAGKQVLTSEYKKERIPFVISSFDTSRTTDNIEDYYFE